MSGSSSGFAAVYLYEAGEEHSGGFTQEVVAEADECDDTYDSEIR